MAGFRLRCLGRGFFLFPHQIKPSLCPRFPPLLGACAAPFLFFLFFTHLSENGQGPRPLHTFLLFFLPPRTKVLLFLFFAKVLPKEKDFRRLLSGFSFSLGALTLTSLGFVLIPRQALLISYRSRRRYCSPHVLRRHPSSPPLLPSVKSLPRSSTHQ